MFVKIQENSESFGSHQKNIIYSLTKECKNDSIIDSKILNIMAVQNPSTPNPLTSLSTNKIITVFITSKKNPSVTMVIGNVKMTKIGFKKANKKPKINATIIATE